MITSIELYNWKTHKSTHLSFSKGTNIIIGQMGAGKSSVMDAISFALFGTFPSIQHRKMNVSYLIRSKPEQEDAARIKLSFEVEGHSYEVERAISQSASSSAKLSRDGAYLQSQPQRVTEEIEKILKMDYDLFSRAVYSQQNSLDHFLNLNSSSRKHEIDNLLGLDKFSTSKENVTTLTNRIKEIIKEGNKNISGLDLGKLKEQYEELAAEARKHSEAVLSLENKAAEISKRLALEEGRLKDEKGSLNSKNSMLQEAKVLKGRADAFNSEVKEIDRKGTRGLDEVAGLLSAAKKEYDYKAKRHKETSDKEKASNSSTARAEEQLKAARDKEAKRIECEKELKAHDKERAEKALAGLKESMDKESAALARYSAEMAESEKNLIALEKHLGKCPVCEKTLDESLRNKLIGERREKIRSFSSMIAESEKLLASIRKEQDSFSKELAKVSQLEEKAKVYANAPEEIKELSSALAAESENNKRLRAEAEAAEKDAVAAKDMVLKLESEKEAAQTRERYKKEMHEITKLASEKESGANKIQVTEEVIDKLHKEVVRLSSELSRSESELKSNKAYAADKEKQRKEREAQILSIKKMEEDISTKRKTADNLDKFSLALGEAQAQLRSQLIDSINRVMSGIWPELYPYRDYSDIMLEASEDDYTLKVNTLMRGKPSWEEVEAIASGGERSTACLAMRIAFSLVLAPNIKWLILDEPTHNLDQQAVSKLVGIFGETLPRIIDQVFIITHDDMLKEVREGNVYMLNRDKAQDRETEVEQT